MVYPDSSESSIFLAQDSGESSIVFPSVDGTIIDQYQKSFAEVKVNNQMHKNDKQQ